MRLPPSTQNRSGASWHQYQPNYVPYYYSPPTLWELFEEPSWLLHSIRTIVKWISLRRGLDTLEHKLWSGFEKPAMAARRLAGRLELPYFGDDLIMAVIGAQTTPVKSEAPKCLIE